jgi:penicillin-binding protein 1C
MYRIVRYIKKNKKKSIVLSILLIFYAFCLPSDLFKDPTATVITSKNNELLGAQIASDGQWRFPHNDSITEKFKTFIVQFEDEYFYDNPGFKTN